MLEIKQITPVKLFENRQHIDEYLKNEFSESINEESWMKDYEELIKRFQLYKFNGFTEEECADFQWDTEQLNELVTETFGRVCQYLDFNKVLITIVPALPFSFFKKQPKSLWTNAFTNGPGNIIIAVPTMPDKDFFQYLLAHELHHASPQNPIYNLSLHSFTLEEWFKMEGTAEYFSLSLYPDKRWWKDNLPKEMEQDYWNKIKEHLKATDDHVKSTLCFGSPENGVPVFAGYSFALKVVSQYASTYPVEDMIDLFSIDASELTECYRNSII